jgi:hypothetical protein
MRENKTMKPLDEILSNPLLADCGSDGEFEGTLDDSTEVLQFLYRSSYGLKFMLFQGEDNNCYLRVQNSIFAEREHKDIARRFLRESNYDQSIVARGGGDVQARRTEGRTELFFHSSSDVYGKFDYELLTTLLDASLDKRIDYEVSKR